ncbi:MAG: hypothetical protein ACRD0G_15015, partial [Acidimicrobiales bacterium]
MEFVRTATVVCAATLVLPLSGQATAGDEQQEQRDCVHRLLDVASTNTDNFPTLGLLPDRDDAARVAAVIGIHGEVRCLGEADAPGIKYFVVDGEVEVDEDLGRALAISDDLVVIEPGGDAQARLDDPGPTWSEVDGATGVVDQLLDDGAVAWIGLGLPDPDRSPVSLLGASIRSTGQGREAMHVVDIVWRFADGAADAHVEEVESALSDSGLEPTTIDVEPGEIHAAVELTGDEVPLPPRLIALALLDSSAAAEDSATASDVDADEAQRFPDVIDVAAECADDGYDFGVTISSPYDTPERYADG